MMIRVAPFAVFAGCVFTALWAFTSASDAPQKIALRPLIVHKAQPSKQIEHDVEWKGVSENARRESILIGPQWYAMEMEMKPNATEAILFGWYELSPGGASVTSSPRQVRVSADQGATVATFGLGESAFFLSQTQQLAEGTPAELPDGLSQFVAYRITEAPGHQPEVKLTTSSGKPSFQFKRPAFVCLPVEEWHHDEHFAVKDPSACWIVYEISPVEHSTTVSTLDQFGLNQLELGSAKWVCVPARTVTDASVKAP